MSNNICYIPVENIVPNIYQPRQYFNEEAIDELAQSIKVYGIIQPLTVRKLGEQSYELVAGERRYRAAKRVGLNEVPTIIINVDDKESAVLALLENLQREDLNFLEEAEAYQNLIKDHSYTQDQLAEVIGKKQSTIANKLRILKLDEEIRKALIEHNLTERHGRALLKLPTVDLQKEVLNKVIKDGLNVKNTEELIDRELLKLTINNENEEDNKNKIKSIFSPRVYMNTIKQVFDKYGISANYRSKELEDSIQVTVTIPKNK
ncbi:nucleoid occlusion protein [Hathewaya massiliensis]|uniref:nucleoid occlusion protein n=1 Tax=Hathewaya massiliensis TaxID=1964382 RepID=UPI001159E4C6|nr:nucleoid occlusion protein [Hathewaya massiliensis]